MKHSFAGRRLFSGWAGLLLACGGLAESRRPAGEATDPLPASTPSCSGPSCDESGTLEPPAPAITSGRSCDAPAGIIYAADQGKLDTLAGCEQLTGSLTLRTFPGMDPSPLRALRRVEGTLTVFEVAGPGAPVLDALSALEEVGSLVLDGLALTSLAPLRQLRSIGARDASGSTTGSLQLRDIAGLRSLQGLDALELLGGLELDSNPDLSSLSGLNPEVQPARLYTTDTPLESLEGLNGLQLRDVTILGSQLRDLRGLGALPQLIALTLSDNALLSSLQGARMPERLEVLTLGKLTLLADLRGLEGLRQVSRMKLDNDAPTSALTSLDGLDGLQRVDRLELVGFTQLTTLQGLGGLQEAGELLLDNLPALGSLQGLSGLERAGQLRVSGASLGSLAGLGSPLIDVLSLTAFTAPSLAGLQDVRIGSELTLSGAQQLVSLAGLPQLNDSALLYLSLLPALDDLEALRAYTSLGTLTLESTGVRHLDALTELRQLAGLALRSNARLSQIDGVAGLVRLGMLAVSENPTLRALPLFPALELPSCVGCPGFVLILDSNPVLEAGPGLPLVSRAQSVTVVRNPRLTSLTGLAALQTADAIWVEANSSLPTFSLPALTVANEIRIRHNPALDDAPLSPLQSLANVAVVKIVSNRSGPAALTPCPWTGDDECDESGGDCALGSDSNDCGLL